MIHNGARSWSTEDALDRLHLSGVPMDEVYSELSQLHASLAPASGPWIVDRLTMLGMMFSVGRAPTAAETLAAWMTEASRLLRDIPHDLLAHSIDEAIKAAKHGFMPSVGEIRVIAEPLVQLRNTQLDRLALMVSALADPEATEKRDLRWQDIDLAASAQRC